VAKARERLVAESPGAAGAATTEEDRSRCEGDARVQTPDDDLGASQHIVPAPRMQIYQHGLPDGFASVRPGDAIACAADAPVASAEEAVASLNDGNGSRFLQAKVEEMA
jgi:hypothetical protein